MTIRETTTRGRNAPVKPRKGASPSQSNTDSDSEILLNIFAHELQIQERHALTPDHIFKAVAGVHESARGGYAIVSLLLGYGIVAFRDPWGVRPLCLGRLGDIGYVVASESCALGTVGAQYMREIERGEIVRISVDGLESVRTDVETAKSALCMFEYIYFARPDSSFNERSVYMARYEMGRQLAREHPVEADVVMAVPDSAVAG